MITESVLELIKRGREGHNQGISIGMPKLEGIIDGLTRSTYYLLFGGTGSGKFLEICRSEEESSELLLGKNGEGCDATAVVNSEIAKGSESPYSVESE